MTAQEIANRLAEFDSADEIAATLAVLGIKGELRCSEACPLAVATGSRVNYVEVGVGRAVAALPLQASNFLTTFDNGLYPQLDVRHG